MSGVYIKGMRMPKDRPLIIKINPDGTVNSTFRNNYRKYEAVSVPDHGRLIDADAMEKEVCGGCKHGEHKYENCIDCALANAPTIIPADKEVDNG